MTAESRLKVGVDVPWVTSWSEEPVLGVGPCASVGGASAVHQAERPGIGRPNYSRNHMNRQRWSVARMLCPMCGAPTRHGDRWTQTGAYLAAGVLRARGFAQVLPSDLPDARLVLSAGAIAPLHRACAEGALRRCPHLGGLPSTALHPFPEQLGVFPLTVSAAPAHALAARAPPAAVSFLQLYGVTDRSDPAWRRSLAEAG